MGLYGKTSGYYATVEQQGRLTLHLHMLVWIKNSLTPQEIRESVLDPKSDFQTRIVQYLESVHQGEFLTGTEQLRFLSETKRIVLTGKFAGGGVSGQIFLPKPWESSFCIEDK